MPELASCRCPFIVRKMLWCGFRGVTVSVGGGCDNSPTRKSATPHIMALDPRVHLFAQVAARSQASLKCASSTVIVNEGIIWKAMANAKHLAQLKKGVGAWNAWRKSGRARSPVIPRGDFFGPDLSKADLAGFDFRGAYLVGVDLRQAKLQRARFDNANLRGADMTGADLRKAVFKYADVSQADFSSANLTGANLRATDLRMSRFRDAVLASADLQFADLRGTSFTGVNLTGCAISNALLLSTVLCDTTLRNMRGLESCAHEGPSAIDYHTLAKSDKLPVEFLRGCGLSDGFINRLPNILDDAATLRCFISYSVKNEKFVDQLHTDLQRRGIRCWYFRHNARWGQPLWEEIDGQINQCDRFILVCSRDALQSEAVLRELERALQREQRERRNLLFPLRIDEYIFQWQHSRKADVVSRVIGDFCRWRAPGSYSAAIETFLNTVYPITPEEAPLDG